MVAHCTCVLYLSVYFMFAYIHIYTSASTHLYTGVMYSIPIAIWPKSTHPCHPPMVYVTPTPGMGIQENQFVDANGVVYLPYLSQWKMVGS